MIHNFFDMLQDARSEIVGGLVVTLVTTLVSLAFRRFWPQWGKLIKETVASLLLLQRRWIVALAIALAVMLGVIITSDKGKLFLPPSCASTCWTFIITRASSDSTIVPDGEEIIVRPNESLILNLGTDGGTPVPSGVWSCYWDAPTGHIDTPDSCTDVVYRAPGVGTDIVGLTVNGGSVKSYQLSPSITVK